MALTFIGKGPDVLPIPEGLQLDPRRYVASCPWATKKTSSEDEYMPRAPSRIKVRYTFTDKDGRLKQQYAEIEPIPEGCTVKGLISYIHEFGPLQLQQLSIRTPVQLRYHGQMLDFEKKLEEYAIKDGAELQMVVKPKLADFAARAAGDPKVERLRIVSHKLGLPTVIDALTPETTMLQIKERLSAYFKENPSWLIKGPQPPPQAPMGGIAGPRAPITMAMNDGTNVELHVGDHLIKDAGPPGGGAKEPKGAAGMLRRVNGGPTNFPYFGEYLVEKAKVDPELWQIVIDLGSTEVEIDNPDGTKTKKMQKNDPWLNLFHAGLPLKDEQTVGSLPIVNNDQLFLNFFAPYDVPDPDPDVIKAKGGGKGKKKK